MCRSNRRIFIFYPKGITALSPGLRRRSYPGSEQQNSLNPEGDLCKRPLERRPPARRGSIVAQICNLLYRRIAFCESRIFVRQSRKRTLCRLQIGDTADYKSALRPRRAGGRRSNFAEISNAVAAGWIALDVRAATPLALESFSDRNPR